MDNILIDTDVILDFFFDRKPFSDYSALIIGKCELKMITGYITPVIISNLYYILKKNNSHNYVINQLKKLLTFIDILKKDKYVVINALNSEFKDFEDALQHFSALSDKRIDYIITRNIKDYKNSSITVLTPENYLTIKQSAN
jgi:predicted nucleic acid-binding protein